MNIGMNVSFLFSVFVYFEYIPSSGIAGSYGSFIFIFLRKLHTVFHGDSTSLYSHQLCTRVALSPHSHQYFLVVFFLMITILTDWRKQWHPTPVLLPGKSMDGGAWKAAVRGVAEGRTRLSYFTFTFTFTFMHWRRNGNPLQCSCLENPRDGGAWWAAICGVTQSRTRLK